MDGERGWLDGGFGKLRSGSDGDLRVQTAARQRQPGLAPQFSLVAVATVVGSVQGGERTEAGLSQAYLTFRPMRGSKIGFSAPAPA